MKTYERTYKLTGWRASALFFYLFATFILGLIVEVRALVGWLS